MNKKKLKRHPIKPSGWKKHPKCKECVDGIVGYLQDYLCGSQGVKMDYCPTCYNLWKDDFNKKFGRPTYLYHPSPEEIVKLVTNES